MGQSVSAIKSPTCCSTPRTTTPATSPSIACSRMTRAATNASSIFTPWADKKERCVSQSLVSPAFHKLTYKLLPFWFISIKSTKIFQCLFVEVTHCSLCAACPNQGHTYYLFCSLVPEFLEAGSCMLKPELLDQQARKATHPALLCILLLPLNTHTHMHTFITPCYPCSCAQATAL